MKFDIIPDKRVELKRVKMNRGHSIKGNDGMFLQNYNFCCLLVGPSGSGKSSVWVNLLKGQLYKKFDRVEVFSPSLHTIQTDLGLSEDRMHEELDFDYLQETTEALRQKKRDDPDSDYQTLWVIDDFLSEITSKSKDVNKLSIFSKIILNRSHCNLQILICSQTLLKGIPNVLRKNASHIVFLKNTNKAEREALRDEYTNMTSDEFNDLIKFVFDEPYDFLAIRTQDDTYWKNLLQIIIHR